MPKLYDAYSQSRQQRKTIKKRKKNADKMWGPCKETNKNTIYKNEHFCLYPESKNTDSLENNDLYSVDLQS